MRDVLGILRSLTPMRVDLQSPFQSAGPEDIRKDNLPPLSKVTVVPDKEGLAVKRGDELAHNGSLGFLLVLLRTLLPQQHRLVDLPQDVLLLEKELRLGVVVEFAGHGVINNF